MVFLGGGVLMSEVQAAWTTAELREITRLPGVRVVMQPHEVPCAHPFVAFRGLRDHICTTYGPKVNCVRQVDLW